MKFKQFKFIDLFSGIGAFNIALKNCGGECVFASEIDPYAIETYKQNFHIDSNYDITNVKIHDKIQVITDSTHDNQSTIYSWENNSWSYVGMFGPYYTKSQVDAIHQTNNLVVTYNNEIVTLSVG